MEKVYIVGAHSRGRTLKAYLEYLQEAETEAFLVDDLTENPNMADGVPVKLISAGLDTEKKVYIGTRGVSHEKLTEELKAVGMQSIVPVTVELDRRLRNEYVRRRFREEGRVFRMIDELGIGRRDGGGEDGEDICDALHV